MPSHVPLVRGRDRSQITKRARLTGLLPHPGEEQVDSQGAIRWTPAAVPIAHLSGELDMANAVDVFAAIRTGFDGTELVVDLSDVAFIDSSALAQLVALSGEVAVRVVAPLDHGPSRVLELTGLTRLLPTFATVDAALDSTRW
jgi:anti-anti-sigma factor